MNPKMGKFQVLIPRVRIAGTVAEVDGSDFDLLVNWGLDRLNFAYFDSVIHCERYAHSGLPAEESAPPLDIRVGDTISVVGSLVLDCVVHESEEAEHPDRVGRRWGLLKTWRCKPELHPYLSSTIVQLSGPPPDPDFFRSVTYWREVYAYTWFLNRLLGLGERGVGGSATSRLPV